MKLNTIVNSMLVFGLGLSLSGVSSAAFAVGDYYPPERMHCMLSAAGKLSCSDFNRQYLVEDTYTANLEVGKDMIFRFARGVAFSAGANEWSIFYTYKNADGKNVKLKTSSILIKPDLQNGAWTSFKNYYTCTTGYMSCPIVLV
jgi:hypothetical protein